MRKTVLLPILFVVVLLAVGVIATAQQATKIPRIGYLGSSAASNSARIEAFRQGLRELGYVEGKNIVIEYRYAEGEPDRERALAAELVRLKVDVIVTGGSTATRPAKAATVTIPIVMTQDSDPVGNGFVASLARPGGNITGLVQLCPRAKRKAAGASEGGRSQALARGRVRECDRPRQRTNVKRDRTRCRGIRSKAAIPRDADFQGSRNCIPSRKQGAELTQSSCW